MDMKVEELLVELSHRGLRVEIGDGDRLKIGPTRLLDDETIARIKAVKPSIIACLSRAAARTWPCSRCGRFAFSRRPVVCYWCRRAADMEVRA